MDHGGHDMPMGPKCSMHMLWNTEILNTCIIFPSWHIDSNTTFILSFIAIVLLGVFYEYLRLLQRRVDVYVAQVISSGARAKGRARSPLRSESASPGRGEEQALLTGRKLFKVSSNAGVPIPFIYRLLRSLIYGSIVFLSFFLMLVFMTYNAYLILATVLGAIIGHFKFGARMNADAVLADHESVKGMACH
uniref:Copper transport protein n=1 Tax=Amanita strobiliformis TaxID=67730 RepID=K4J3J4_9AGAR|nr:copper transport protein CTR4 [Amanita strobiliformis]